MFDPNFRETPDLPGEVDDRPSLAELLEVAGDDGFGIGDLDAIDEISF